MMRLYKITYLKDKKKQKQLFGSSIFNKNEIKNWFLKHTSGYCMNVVVTEVHSSKNHVVFVDNLRYPVTESHCKDCPHLDFVDTNSNGEKLPKEDQMYVCTSDFSCYQKEEL